jgi:hypothetical protein
MLLKFFNSNRLGVFVFLILLPVLYWIPDMINDIPAYGKVYAGTLPGKLIQQFSDRFQVFSAVIALMVIIVNAYLLVQLNTIHIFIPARTQMPALFYILLAACFNPLHQLTPALLASSLIIMTLYRIVKTYKSDGLSFNFLDAGFLIALASLIYFQAILVALLLPIGLILLRPFSWREWTYIIVGLGLPYLFLISGYYFAGVPISEYFTGMSEIFDRNRQTFNAIQLISGLYISAILMYGSYFMVTTIDNMKIHGRKIFLLFLWFFLIAGINYFAVPGTGLEMLSFTAIPVSFLFSHYFFRCHRNWINEILFSVFLVLLILLWIL